jgi:hypothetical protein
LNIRGVSTKIIPKMANNPPIIPHDPKPLNRFTVYEHDLRALSSGSSEGQIYLNLACALVPLGVAGIVGLASTDASHIKLVIFHSVLAVFGVGLGLVFLILWRRAIKDKKPLLDSLLDAPISSGPLGEDGNETDPTAAGQQQAPKPNAQSS